MKTNSTAKKITSIVFLAAIVATSAALSGTVFLRVQDGGAAGGKVIEVPDQGGLPPIPEGEKSYLAKGVSKIESKTDTVYFKYDTVSLDELKNTTKVSISGKTQYGEDIKLKDDQGAEVDAVEAKNITFYRADTNTEVTSDIVLDKDISQLDLIVRVNDSIKKQALDKDNHIIDTTEDMPIKDSVLSLKVNPVTDLVETININDSFSKKLYKMSEAVDNKLLLDLSALQVSIDKDYRTDNTQAGRKHIVGKPLSSDQYTIKINDRTLTKDEIANGYSLNRIGSYKIEISAKGEYGNDLTPVVDYIESYNDYYVLKDGTSQKSNIQAVNFEDGGVNSNTWSKPTARATLDITRNGSSSDIGNVVNPRAAKVEYTISDTYGTMTTNSANSTITLSDLDDNPIKKVQSKGDLNILVIPILNAENDFTGQPAEVIEKKEKALSLIQRTFFGSSSGVNYESLHSYYYKSSNKQLNIRGIMTDWIDVSKLAGSLGLPSSIEGYSDTNAVDKVIKSVVQYIQEKTSYKTQTGSSDWSDFCKIDSNKFDAIYFVNSHSVTTSPTDPFKSKVGYLNDTSTYKQVGNYVWTSMDYLNGKSKSLYDNSLDNKQSVDSLGDAHDLIYLTGRLMGLSDYVTKTAHSFEAPLGRADMMDSYVGDLNAYAKMQLGWVTPYLINGTVPNVELSFPDIPDGNGAITSETKGYPVLVFPVKGKSYTETINAGSTTRKFNLFGEYLLAELYTDTGLNSQGYDITNTENIKQTGFKLYHVDSRLFTKNGSTNDYELVEDVATAVTSGKKLYRLISNDRSTTSYQQVTNPYKNFEEIRLINFNGKKLDKENCATNGSLLRTKFDKKDEFIKNNIMPQFNDSRFNGGQEIDFKIDVKSLTK